MQVWFQTFWASSIFSTTYSSAHTLMCRFKTGAAFDGNAIKTMNLVPFASFTFHIGSTFPSTDLHSLINTWMPFLSVVGHCVVWGWNSLGLPFRPWEGGLCDADRHLTEKQYSRNIAQMGFFSRCNGMSLKYCIFLKFPLFDGLRKCRANIQFKLCPSFHYWACYTKPINYLIKETDIYVMRR